MKPITFGNELQIYDMIPSMKPAPNWAKFYSHCYGAGAHYVMVSKF